MENGIVLSQLGFLPGLTKEVTFKKEQAKGRFEIIDQAGNPVFQGSMSSCFHNVSTDELCARGDFSALDVEGEYRVKVGDAVSAPFCVGEKVYDELIQGLFYMLHLQRCGC